MKARYWYRNNKKSRYNTFDGFIGQYNILKSGYTEKKFGF